MSAATALPPHLSNGSPAVSTPRASRHRPSPSASPQHSSPRSTSPRGSRDSGADVETVLRSHGGDARKALEAVLADRATMQSQNTQLWKLIEKSRGSTLVADIERLRSDLERANERLTTAGLEPVQSKKMSTSSSAVGLGLKAEAPPIRRNNSDRDDKLRSTLQVPSPSSSIQSSPEPAASAPVPAAASSSAALLPSPLTVSDTKLRRESRMAFPPEVSSFMFLADSPREAQHMTPQLPTSNSNNTLSPSSLYSESASEAIAPSSSRALAMTTETVVEEPQEEEQQDTVSLPIRKESLASPARSTHSLPTPTEFSGPPSYFPPSSSALPTPANDSGPPTYFPPSDEPGTPQRSIDNRQGQSTRDGRTTPDSRPSFEKPSHGPLSRLNPALLSYSRLEISNSTVYPNALGRDVLCFIVSITVRPPNGQTVSWNVAKLFSAFMDLDTKIKAKSGKNRKEWKALVAALPEARAWKDFAPGRIDSRKKALEAYLQSLLVAPLSDKTDLCDFLNSDKVQAKQAGVRKEGYLTKKGKNFGGWKTRYFVLDGPVMEYYETRGGTHLGSIVISGAQIGRQNRPSDSSDDRDFRHAFLIIEQAKKGGLRHVLCAESDKERDNWIEVLVRHVDPDRTLTPPPPPPQTVQSPPQSALSRRRSNSRKSSKDVIVTAAQPLATLSSDSKFGGAPSPSLINSMESKRLTHAVPPSSSVPSIASQVSSASSTSMPPNGSQAPHNPLTLVTSPSSEILSSSPPTVESGLTPRANKRQSVMPQRPSHSAAYLSKIASEGLTIPGMESREKERDRKAKSGRFWPNFGRAPEKVARPVFGVPLADSIAIASKANLPAIVFRCIEYLEAKHAEEEEGIYRLSGSSAVIKGLKDKFDMEGDVNLRQNDEHWDPHAIAGLLKTFLRDLPHSLLTRDLHQRFLAVMDLIDSAARVSELSRLVSELPPPNYALLRALTAHLILIVRNSSTNKMTLRNIGIVFCPTLSIPAGIFSELVSHFGPIFDDDPVAAVVPDSEESATEDAEETVKRKRNSMLYQAGGADAMLGLGGRHLEPAAEDSASEDESDADDSETPSIASEDDHSTTHSLTPRPEGYPSAAAVRKAKAAARSADLTVDATNGLAESNRSPGLPGSPRPSGPA